MEFFGFTFGSPSVAVNFPFSPETVIKGYPDQLKEHPSFLSVPFSSYDLVPVDFSALCQGLMDSYYSTLQTPVARGVGAGIIATAIIYCTWKITASWKSHLSAWNKDTSSDASQAKLIKAPEGNRSRMCSQPGSNKPNNNLPVARAPPKKNNLGHANVPVTKNFGSELATVSENFQRQLIDALSKLDDVRFKLKELESQKELLAAEIELRKKITQRLHLENSSEREKRQQAELKMEMMEIENSQLRQLRRELSLKMNQVEKLETFIKEKENLQTKLFEDNVVIPRAVAEVRAKEFGTLQSRVHQLQTEVDEAKRLLGANSGCYPTISLSSAWPKDVPMLQNVPSISGVSVSPTMNILSETSVVLPTAGHSLKGPNTKRKLPERSPNNSRSQFKLIERSPRVTRSRTSPELHLQNKAHHETSRGNTELCVTKTTKPVANINVPSTTCLNKTEDHGIPLDVTSNKGVGVFAHLKAFISGFRDSSSESEFINPLEHSPKLNGQAARMKPIRVTKHPETNRDYPLSDGQSSVFMSASGGSGLSDTDHPGEPTRAGSGLSKKKMCLKRFSKCKRDRRREKERSAKRKRTCHLLPGQTPMEDTLDAVSDSSDGSHKSTLKNFPITARAGGNSPRCSKCSGSSKDGMVSTLESSDENSPESGDSWIVITPANS